MKKITVAINNALESEKNGIMLPHINLVEDPQYAGRKVVVKGEISSTSVTYIVPKKVCAYKVKEDGTVEQKEKEIATEDEINLQLINVPEETRRRKLRSLFADFNPTYVREESSRALYWVKVRPPVFSLKKEGKKVIDEYGFEYKTFDAYIVLEIPLTFESCSIVELYCIPTREPKTQRLVLLTYKIEFLEESSNYNLEDLKRLKHKLDSFKTVEEKVSWILDNFSRFSKIVKRRNVAFASLLAFFSPLYIHLGTDERGWAIVMILGDTTTGKSETNLKIISWLNAGTFITAESASQVGLLGTVEQVGKEGWMINWGSLALADRKLLVIDGYHKLPFSASLGVAEAERQGIVTIVKAAKGSTYARTRQIKIANPTAREEGLAGTKPMRNFVYPCLALTTILDATSIARLDLAVFTCADDVAPEDVNQLMENEPEPEFMLYREAIKWCWSNKAQIVVSKETENEILKSATELYHEFHSERIPLVSTDQKFKILRLATALAYLTLSSDESFEKVFVKPEHVRYIVNFMREEYRKAGLNVVAKEERFNEITAEDAESIIKDLIQATSLEEEKLNEILKFIVLQGRVTKDVLSSRFNLADKSELRPLLATLESRELIRRGNGFYPTARLIQLFKIKISSEPQNEPRLPCLPTLKQDPLPDVDGMGSYSDDGKSGNHGKLQRYLQNKICRNCKYWNGPSSVNAANCSKKGVVTTYDFSCNDFEPRGDEHFKEEKNEH